METQTKTKSDGDKSPRAVVPGFTRFPEHIKTNCGRFYVPPSGKRTRRDRYWFDPCGAVVMHKNNQHGWATRTKCGQRWVAYSPVNADNFRAQQAPTLKKALLILAGWLNFNEEETQKHTN